MNSKLDRIVERAAGLPRLAVASPADEASLNALRRAVDTGLVRPIIIGDETVHERATRHGLTANSVTLMHAVDPAASAELAVRLVSEDKADLLMKGLVGTDVFVKAILDKRFGLLPAGAVLTHVTIADLPTYDRLLLFGDSAIIPYPSPEQRRAQLRTLAGVARSLGINVPRVALIHCSEKPAPRHFPYTADYTDIVEQAKQGKLGDIKVDGPLDVKTSCCAEAAAVKGINSEVAGRADVLLFPDINSANAFYKAITLFGGATTAGLLCGARVPAVVPSRGDNADTKFYSIAAAVCAINNDKQ